MAVGGRKQRPYNKCSSCSNSRNTTTESFPPRCRRRWAPSQMTLYAILHPVSLACSYTLTMLCRSAAMKGCFSLTMFRTPQVRDWWEMLFERVGTELPSPWPTFQTGCKMGPSLSRLMGSKSKMSPWGTHTPRKCLVFCTRCIRKRTGGAQGASGTFRKGVPQQRSRLTAAFEKAGRTANGQMET